MARTFTPRIQRRKTQWVGFGAAAGGATIPTFVTVPVGSAVILSQGMIVGGAAGLVDEEVTITRMIGSLGVVMASATVGAEATVAVGLAVARAEAITAGVGSLLSPESDPDFEWLYYSVLQLHNGLSAGGEATFHTVMRTMDVKGQRVVRAGQSTVWLAESETSSTEIAVGGRYLVKLP